MSKHSPAPWTWVDDGRGKTSLVAANKKEVCNFGVSKPHESTAGEEPSEADKARIVACVNFCREFPTEFLEKHQMRYLENRDTDSAFCHWQLAVTKENQ